LSRWAEALKQPQCPSWQRRAQEDSEVSEGNEVGIAQPDVGPDYTESLKLLAESSKQLTTLNAGAIVIIGTFLQDIFPSKGGALVPDPLLKVLIALSFVCFGVSLVMASFVMVYFSRRLTRHLEGTWFRRRLQIGGPPPESIDYTVGALVQRFLGRRRARPPGKLRIFLYANASLSPLPFFTTGVLSFGLAVVLNLFR
jgi:hypothetical protein